MSNTTSQWDEVLDRLNLAVDNPYQYNTWFKNLKPMFLSADRLIVVTSDKFVCSIIRQRHAQMIQNVVNDVYGRNIELQFCAESDIPAVAPAESKPVREEPLEMMLNPKYTFDSFVIGASNRFAHAASLAVAELPADAYNPLFLYGGVGLGKTHLMHAIGHHILQSNPNAKLLYITSEKFTTMMIDAIAKKTNDNFRERMRTVDVLMIDDIQFIAGKTATQEEFFHTFNELHSNGKQIIISSDRPPKEISTLEERLRSRFEWGLLADIQKPDLETRIAILRRKADVEHVSVEDDVLHFIAEKTESNIRELEGLLTRVSAQARLDGIGTITMETARGALGEIFPMDVKKKKRTPETIIQQVAEYYNITVADILSARRNREVARPRQIAMYLVRELTKLSTTRIGEVFGGRDHSTVMYACEKIAELLSKDEKLKNDVLHLQSK